MSALLSFIVIALGLLVPAGFLIKSVLKPYPQKISSNLELTTSVVAWLRAGPRRVADTWWAEMREKRLLVPRPDGLHFDPLPNQSFDTLDRFAQKAFLVIGQNKTPHEIIKMWQGPLGSLRYYMEQGGWLVSEDLHAKRTAEIFRFVLLGLALCVAAWIFAGLGPLFFVLLTEIVVIALIANAKIPSRLTEKGQKDLKKFQDENHHKTLAPRKDDIPVAVALGGAGVLIGTPYVGSAPPITQKQKDGGGSGCGSGCGGTSVTWGSDQGGTSDGSGCSSSGGDGGGCGGGCGGD